MNEITTQNNTELKRLIDGVAERKKFMETERGMSQAQKRMMKLFAFLTMSGYRIPDADYSEMAKVWVDLLRDVIITFGFEVIEEALKEFVANDSSEYKQLPSPGQLIEKCREIGKDPEVEIARMEHELQVAAILREADRELEELRNGH